LVGCKGECEVSGAFVLEVESFAIFISKQVYYKNKDMRYLKSSFTLFIFVLVFFNFHVRGQNLIPNPSFEMTSLIDCPNNPDEGLQFVNSWYDVSLGTDLFVGECSPEYIVFAEERPESARTGQNFLGMWASTYAGGLMTGDAFGVELVNPLEEGLYKFSVYINNRGTINPANPGFYCSTNPQRHIAVHLSEDSLFSTDIYSDNGLAVVDTYVSGVQVYQDFSPLIRQTSPSSNWFLSETIIKACGGEKHLAITPSLGISEYEAGCGFDPNDPDFQSYYYDFDDVSLSPISFSLDREFTICAEEGTEVNVLDLIGKEELPAATVVWPDGLVANTRLLKEGGDYDLELQFYCGSIPFVLEVEAVKCKSEFYIPSAFSPNRDNNNDDFKPFINNASIISNYKFSIYNRWGQLVFHTEDYSKSWNGFYKERKAEIGEYIWRLEFEVKEEFAEEYIQQSGSVLLIR